MEVMCKAQVVMESRRERKPLLAFQRGTFTKNHRKAIMNFQKAWIYAR